MKPANLLFIISDQHQAAAMGCSGHPLVQTPNLDRLAEGGTRFSNAYTNCAICVPVRAALATGQYVHRIGNWDNGFPYDGTACPAGGIASGSRALSSIPSASCTSAARKMTMASGRKSSRCMWWTA